MEDVDDLVAWLRAQLDSDERAARAAGGREWVWHTDGPPGELLALMESPSAYRIDAATPELRAHIALHAPVRVLREVEAKRRILDQHPRELGVVGAACGRCYGEGQIEVLWDGEEETVQHVDRELAWPCPTVRALASVYADRPGYQEEWRP